MPAQLSYGLTSSWILQSACAGNWTANRQAYEQARRRSDDDEDDDNNGSLGLRFKFQCSCQNLFTSLPFDFGL